MGIGSLGVSELLVVAVLVLVLFGPKRLPEIGRTVGQALRQLKRGMNEVRREIEEVDPTTRSGEGRRPEGRPRGTVRPPHEAGGAEDEREGPDIGPDREGDADEPGDGVAGVDGPGTDEGEGPDEVAGDGDEGATDDHGPGRG